MSKIVNYANSKLLLSYKQLDHKSKSVIKDRGDHLRYLVVKQKGLTVTSCILENGVTLSGVAIYQKDRKNPEEKDKDKGLLISGGRLDAVLKDHFKPKEPNWAVFDVARSNQISRERAIAKSMMAFTHSNHRF